MQAERCDPIASINSEDKQICTTHEVCIQMVLIKKKSEHCVKTSLVCIFWVCHQRQEVYLAFLKENEELNN